MKETALCPIELPSPAEDRACSFREAVAQRRTTRGIAITSRSGLPRGAHAAWTSFLWRG